MSEPSGRRMSSSIILAVSTMIAALFVAVQAWYARVAFVEASETRLLEKQLDICFENFDAAVAVDTTLRATTPGAVAEDVWPPQIMLSDAEELQRLQQAVVPVLNDLESGLTKAVILGPLDRHRAYLSQQISGLSERLLRVNPSLVANSDMNTEVDAILKKLSEFLGAQYLVQAGCRLVAQGET